MSTIRRWSFIADMNESGAVTITDVWLWLEWLYFYPGDYILSGVIEDGSNELGKFFEVTPEWYGGFISGVFSFLGWFMAIMAVLAVFVILSDAHNFIKEKTSRL